MKKTTIIIVITTILLCLGFMFNALTARAEKRVVAWDSNDGTYYKLSQITLDDTTKDITFTANLLFSADDVYSIGSATAAIDGIYANDLDLGTNVLNDTHLGYFLSWEHASDVSKLDGEDIYDNSIDEDSLDFGTSTDQISAIDLPIADSGSLITATEAETALQEVFDKDPTITLTGDVTGTGTHTNLGNASFATTIGADKILESMLKCVNSAIDEYALTYESTTGDFEWQKMAGGVTDHGDLTGLSDDDHTQYLLVNATRGMSATTLIANLNTDLLDSQTGAYYIDSANFTGTNWTDLTDGGDTTLHDHDGISENTAARHTQGTDTTLGTMTADIDMGSSYQITNLQAPAASGEAIRQTAVLTEATLEAAVQNYITATLTQEEVDDYVDALINDADSVHTDITITYDDTDNAMDFVIDSAITRDAEWNTEAEVEAIWAATDIYTSDDDYTNWVVDYMAVSTFTRDAEWDTESEFEAACETKNFIVSTEIDTEAEFEAICATLDFYTSDDSYTDWVQGYMMADDSVDSAEYVNGSIDLVHLAAGVYAKDIVTTSPITGGTDNVLVGADSDVTIAITVLKDLVTTSPLAGGTNDIFPGADSDITISIADAAADGSTKGAATFDANDFDAASGVISIDNVNFTIEDVLASVAAGDMIYRNDSGVWGIISKGADNDVFTMDGNYPNWEAGGAGSGDVTSSANITDHSIVRGDGGAKGVQDSGIIIDDSDRVTGVTQLTINQTDTASSFYVQDGGTDIMEIYDGGIIDMPKQSKARVYRATSSQPVASGVFTKVQFNAANYDIQSEFDIITNYRFTAKKKGYYLISASLRYSASVANKFFMVNIYKNGSSYSRDVEQTAFADELSPNVVDIIFLDIDDYIEIYAYHNAGTNQNIYFMGHNNFCAIHKLS